MPADGPQADAAGRGRRLCRHARWGC